MADYELLLEFDTNDPEFARGFEAGRLWERIKGDHTIWDETIHTTNTEMVMRMCEAHERSFCAEDVDENYVRVWVG